jgi:hypothetical protein
MTTSGWSESVIGYLCVNVFVFVTYVCYLCLVFMFECDELPG